MENSEVASKPVEGGEKQGTGNGLKIATGVACAVAVVGIVVGACFYMDASQKASENATLRAQVDLLQAETGAELVEQTTSSGTIVTTVRSNEDEVKELVVALKDELVGSGVRGVTFDNTFGSGGVVKMPGSDVYTAANKYYGVAPNFYEGVSASMKDEAIESVSNMVTNYLVAHGFSKVKDMEFGDYLYGNSDTGVYCVTRPAGVVYELSGVKCSYEDWYDTDNEELLLALAGASGVDYIMLPDGSKISNSKVSPYQTITASVRSAALLFYRVSPSAEWQFFTGTQAEIECSAYNTQDLKNAFAGERCWDEATQSESTVQP